jgi:hypothetical protein
MKQLLILTTLLALTACKEPITDGRVTDKRHDPERTYMVLTPIFGANGTSWVQQQRTHLEAHYLILQKTDDDGLLRTNDLKVSGETYHLYVVGDYYP